MTVTESCETGLFRDFPFRESILRDIEAAGYERPTPVQAECIPPALEGRDVIGLAQTGTGKTAAFALPIIQKFAGRQEMCALVLAPTRELAAQIGVMFKQLGHSSGVHAAVVVGGVPIEKDFKALRNWPTVLIATPGRLIDHIRSHTVSLKDIEVLVIDEADRMHDMGFIPQVRRILDALPVERQTLIFTATLPDDVERIVRQNMRSPVRVQVGRRSAPAERAEQKLFQVHEEQKTPLLLEMLREGDGRILVFVRTKRRVDKLARAITGRCGRVARIHGDREQNQRDDAMGGFREGRYRILIATDIAARGIDVADIEHVINYDFPLSPEDYVHRIGRTARVEASGTATSFVTGADRKCVAALERLIGKKLPVTLSNVATGAAPALEPRRGRHSRRRRRETGPHDVRRASHRN